jgi:NADH-quinone oxidoreductase subunit N
MKYFILGAIASGMMLFGISCVYGVTGHTGFTALGEMLSGEDMPAALILGLVLILAGMAFKISAVPFHMWTPDVYQGAPSSITAFFAIVPKLAAMCLLIRLLTGPFIALEEAWVQILYVMSVGSMVLGAFAGIVQKNIKRLLAYSSIGNIGYALVGLIAFGLDGLTGVVVYMIIYMLTSIGAFGVFLSLRMNDGAIDDMDAYKGLAKTHPFYAYVMAIFLFSLAGIPPLAGFFGKLLVFKAAVDQGFIILAVIGVLTSVVAAYYYIKLIKMMFFDSVERGLDNISVLECSVQKFVIFLMALICVGFCLMPSALIDVAQNVSHHLFFDMKVVDPSIAVDYISVPEVTQEITE